MRSWFHSKRPVYCTFVALCLTVLVFVPNTVLGQCSIAAGFSSKQRKEAFVNVERGQVSRIDLNIIRCAGDKAILPLLEADFRTIKSDDIKGAIASTLLRLGDEAPSYWTYVVGRAMQAVRCNAPDPDGILDYGSPSKEGKPNMAFQAWAFSQHLNLDQAALLVVKKYPLAITDLASTGDRRAIPILRKGLKSDQLLILLTSVEGLAKFNDVASVREICDIAERSPKDIATEIAGDLVYFSDSLALSTALRLLGPEEFARQRGRALNGRNPLDD